MSKKQVKPTTEKTVEPTTEKASLEVNEDGSFLSDHPDFEPDDVSEIEKLNQESASNVFVPENLEFEEIKTEVLFHRFVASKDGKKAGEPEITCVFCGYGKTFEGKDGKPQKTLLVLDVKNDSFKFLNDSKTFAPVSSSDDVCGDIFRIKFKHRIVLENGNDFNVFDIQKAKTSYPYKNDLIKRVESVRRQWKEGASE